MTPSEILISAFDSISRQSGSARIDTWVKASSLFCEVSGNPLGDFLQAEQILNENGQSAVDIISTLAASSFEWNQEKITKNTLKSFCNSIKYIPYNIYGIALVEPEVYETSIFGDTYDVILVPAEKIVEWSTTKLPIYQYRILDKICSRIENYEPFPGYHSLTSLPRRIYDVVNEQDEVAATAFLVHVHDHLRRLPISLDTIDELNTLWKRGKLLLKLIYLNKINNAYQLSIIKNVNDDIYLKYLQYIYE